MFHHFILLSSSYSLGKRIVYDIVDDQTRAVEIINQIKQRCGNDVSISPHSIITGESDFESVRKFDCFFEDVLQMFSVEEFIKQIEKDRKLSGLDVAKYILSIIPCDHLKLEKLTYLCYADYLESTSERLFEDKIYAYEYGPVIETIYKEFRGHGKTKLQFDNDGKEARYDPSNYSPAKSRILFASKGLDKLRSIDETIKKYGKLTAFELVDLTHKTGTAWARTKQSSIITDKLIKTYHYIEKI